MQKHTHDAIAKVVTAVPNVTELKVRKNESTCKPYKKHNKFVRERRNICILFYLKNYTVQFSGNALALSRLRL